MKEEIEAYTRQVGHHYDKESQEYDEVYTDHIQLAEDQIVMGIIAPFTREGQNVLDIGCGTGLPLTYIDISGYHGIDISSGMIEEARIDHPEKKFNTGDMHYLPFADATMDTIISLFGPFSYSLHPEIVVAEIFRVLKPGGTAVIMPYTQRVGHGLDIGGYSTANATDIQKKFYDKETLQSLFSGFADVQVLGINYFGNTLAHYDKTMGGLLTQGDYGKQLKLEIMHASDMPDIKYARHSVVIAKKPTVDYLRRDSI